MIVPQSLRLAQKSMLSRAAMICKASKFRFSKAWNLAKRFVDWAFALFVENTCWLLCIIESSQRNFGIIEEYNERRHKKL